MAPKAEHAEIEVSGRTVSISSPDKVFFKERGETKLDLVRYVIAVGEPLLRAIGGRPILMERYPDGASGKSFFQKRVPKGAPDWLETVTVATVNGTESDALVAVDVAHLVWAVNLGCLGFHAWPTLAADPEHADELRIDLDPRPGRDVRDGARDGRRGAGAARRARPDRLREDHRPPRHPHLRAPRAAVRLLPGARRRGGRRPRAGAPPARRSAPGPGGRRSAAPRVFVDYNQNAPHKTVFSAWGARARVGGAGVGAVRLGRARRPSIPTP